MKLEGKIVYKCSKEDGGINCCPDCGVKLKQNDNNW